MLWQQPPALGKAWLQTRPCSLGWQKSRCGPDCPRLCWCPSVTSNGGKCHNLPVVMSPSTTTGWSPPAGAHCQEQNESTLSYFLLVHLPVTLIWLIVSVAMSVSRPCCWHTAELSHEQDCGGSRGWMTCHCLSQCNARIWRIWVVGGQPWVRGRITSGHRHSTHWTQL